MPKDDLGKGPDEPVASTTRRPGLWGSMKNEITISVGVDLTQPFFTEAWEPYLGDESRQPGQGTKPAPRTR